MAKIKTHIEIESQRLGQDTYDTFFVCLVTTMPDAERVVMDLFRETSLEAARAVAKLRAEHQGCRVVEAL